MLQALRPRSVDERGQVHLEDRPAMCQRYVLPDAYPDVDLYAQLLDALPDQRLDLGLPRLDLATGKLPSAGDFGRIGARTRQYKAILDNCGTHDDPLYGPFGLHGASACQTKEKVGVPHCPLPPEMTKLWPWTRDGLGTTLGGANDNSTATGWPQAGNDARGR